MFFSLILSVLVSTGLSQTPASNTIFTFSAGTNNYVCDINNPVECSLTMTGLGQHQIELKDGPHGEQTGSLLIIDELSESTVIEWKVIIQRSELRNDGILTYKITMSFFETPIIKGVRGATRRAGDISFEEHRRPSSLISFYGAEGIVQGTSRVATVLSLFTSLP